MKFKLYLFVLLVTSVMTLATGCQRPGQPTPTIADPNASQVILVDTQTFPKEMVGIWENEQYGWILRIEEDGRLSKIRHTIGRANMKAGRTSTLPLIEGGLGALQPGPWYTQYSEKTREFTVEIALEKFRYELGGNVVSGSSRDIFSGTLPAKGQTTWSPDWISFPEYVTTTADREYVDYTLPFDQGQEEMGQITFEKVDPDDPSHDHQH